MMQTDLFITTPVLNAAATIDQTIQSVVSQAGPVRIRYHVQDGGSSDGTWERILQWQARLARGDLPLAGASLQFSCHQAPDSGLYDAIVSGFEAMSPTGNGFLAWINADDIYLPGAFALVAAADRQFPVEMVSWIGGDVSVLRDDIVVAAHDREIPTEIVRAGLCDDVHWPFVQQEGTFFRGWLWNRIEPEAMIRPMTLAGDWNLWRLMAGHAELVQAGRPLASFRVGPDQLSAVQAETYRAEIESILPEHVRRQAFEGIASGAPPTRLRLQSRFAAKSLSLVEEAVDGRRYTRFPDAFGANDVTPVCHIRMEGKCDVTEPVPDVQGQTGSLSQAAKDRLRHVRRGDRIHALDTGWQYPAITEEHAFRRLEAMGGLPEGLVYVAYPWATLIDHLQAEGANAQVEMEVFEAFCNGLPAGGDPRITVCQHILLHRFLHLFQKAGIDHVFWPHTTEADLELTAPRLHPFPLYPVQIPTDLESIVQDRPYLYSFIGARANPHYLTDVRSWILGQLADRPGGLVKGRDDWHYTKIVYHHQIWQATGDRNDQLVDDAAAAEFRDALCSSVFALCPSGSGPNSIRLWEALEAGAIPVILSDDLALPGDPRLWAESAIFCAETPDSVAALPDRLAAIARNDAILYRMRSAGQQLRDLYGRDSFVADILELGRNLAGIGTQQGASANVERFARRILTAPRPNEAEAELLLTLAANDPTVQTDHFAANTSVLTACERAHALLGVGHPAAHLMDKRFANAVPPPEHTQRKASFGKQKSLFPGALAAVARWVAPETHPSIADAELAQWNQMLETAIAAADIPKAALLSDHHAALYRLFLNRDTSQSISAFLSSWHQRKVVEGLEDASDAGWPDPHLARFSRLFGATKVLWSMTQPAVTATEALVLGAIPACPSIPGLDRVVSERVRIDLSGLGRRDALSRILTFDPDPRFAFEWLGARAVLRDRLSDPDRLYAARREVVEMVLSQW